MFREIVSFSIRKKMFVVLTTLLLLAGGIYSMLTLPIDAVPDITNNQVQIRLLPYRRHWLLRKWSS